MSLCAFCPAPFIYADGILIPEISIKFVVRSLVIASLLACATAHAQSPAPALAADQVAVGAKPCAGKLPDVPVVVLTSVQQAEKPMFFLATADAVAVKRSLHADFLKQFSKGSQVVTDRSGHSIQMEEPELVIAAVREVIALADRNGAEAR
ncbi:alpha/beta fold hydrolase [uncultured Massilia sp.]|uniref:alpha/beta fold hydrolase n=1 Tax=uncultured Massilia sp. TaxID=169973 RepID=UPI002585D0D3|nr:hypothetical protein [uncultured Massilia sp.]